MQKTVLITGASSGIGMETAYVYAQNNYNLVLVARRKEKLENIKKDINNKYKVSVDIFDLDLSKTNSANQLYKITSEKSLIIDVLINNAGFGLSNYFDDIDIEREEKMLMLNIVTLTKLSKLYLKDMKKQKSGHIINIASTAAFQAIPGFSTYAASKAYVLHFSEAIARELKNENINVTVICPGATHSEFAKTAGADKLKLFQNIPSSKEIGKFIYNCMIKSRTTAIHGFKNNILAFANRFVSRKVSTILAGKFME